MKSPTLRIALGLLVVVGLVAIIIAFSLILLSVIGLLGPNGIKIVF